MKRTTFLLGLCCLFVCSVDDARGDPCGMVAPPTTMGTAPAVERVGVQKTYVFYRKGIEGIVIRPGFTGRVGEFGMLVPFPSPPAIRKVPDEVFSHIAAAIDPPEVVFDLRTPRERMGAMLDSVGGADMTMDIDDGFPALEHTPLEITRVRVIREEAIGMYEVAVLEAGSARALRRWMTDHGYHYPKGMDGACEDYVKVGWCFVAARTRIGPTAKVTPRPGMQEAKAELPPGGSFSGAVQAMGFRFRTKELVVPMRLSTYNDGDLRNLVYLLAEKSLRIDNVPERFVVRQVPGAQVYRNVTQLLPIRILGRRGLNALTRRRLNVRKRARDQKRHNLIARDLFASDLVAARFDKLSLPSLDPEKWHAYEREKAKARANLEMDLALPDLKDMVLTVIDGEFPRDVLARENLTFSPHAMPAERNRWSAYDAMALGTPQPRPGRRYESPILAVDDPTGEPRSR